MLKPLVLMSLIYTSLFAELMPFAQTVRETKAQLTPIQFKRDMAKYNKYINELIELEESTRNIFDRKENREMLMQKLNSLRLKSGSVIVANIQINTGVKYMGLRKRISEKYISPALQTALDYRLCNGYIFKGEELIGNRKYREAIELYKEGMKHCTQNKILWKFRALDSRLANAEYKYGKKK